MGLKDPSFSLQVSKSAAVDQGSQGASARIQAIPTVAATSRE